MEEEEVRPKYGDTSQDSRRGPGDDTEKELLRDDGLIQEVFWVAWRAPDVLDI